MIIITNNHTINIKTDIYAWKSFNSFLKILKQFSVHSIRKMSSQYKNEYLLKIHPFCSSEIKNNKKKKKKKTKNISRLPTSSKKFTSIDLSK